MRCILALSLVLSALFSPAQQPAPKVAPQKQGAKPAQSPPYKLQDSDKVIFDAIAAIDRYEAAAEKPATEELQQIHKRATAAANQITDLSLRPYIWMMMDQIKLITVDGLLFRMNGEKKDEFKKQIMQYHLLRDGIVGEIKANHCCYPPPGWASAK